MPGTIVSRLKLPEGPGSLISSTGAFAIDSPWPPATTHHYARRAGTGATPVEPATGWWSPIHGRAVQRFRRWWLRGPAGEQREPHMSLDDHVRDLDAAIADTFATHEPGRVVTEWLTIAVTQAFDEDANEATYRILNRQGMLHHHIRGLIDALDDITNSDFIEDDDN